MSEKIPRCLTCDHYEKGGINKGYCNLLSRSGEDREAQKIGAAAYDNFWVREDFYCALHSNNQPGG